VLVVTFEQAVMDKFKYLFTSATSLPNSRTFSFSVLAPEKVLLHVPFPAVCHIHLHCKSFLE